MGERRCEDEELEAGELGGGLLGMIVGAAIGDAEDVVAEGSLLSFTVRWGWGGWGALGSFATAFPFL